MELAEPPRFLRLDPLDRARPSHQLVQLVDARQPLATPAPGRRTTFASSRIATMAGESGRWSSGARPSLSALATAGSSGMLTVGVSPSYAGPPGERFSTGGRGSSPPPPAPGGRRSRTSTWVSSPPPADRRSGAAPGRSPGGRPRDRPPRPSARSGGIRGIAHEIAGGYLPAASFRMSSSSSSAPARRRALS